MKKKIVVVMQNKNKMEIKTINKKQKKKNVFKFKSSKKMKEKQVKNHKKQNNCGCIIYFE